MNIKAATGQWAKLWTSLSTRQRISLALVGFLVCASVMGLVWWRRDQGFKPVFNGLAPEDAGTIVEKLKEGGIEYRLAANGSSVLVREEKVPETRLMLASAGLPKTGRLGFELFDKTNLGTTDFAEQVNYRRALEGELERTIKSIAAVEQARVHLTFPKDSVFLESRLPAKASVLLRIAPGADLAAQNVNAVRYLVASAVEGLSVDAVSIMDMRGNLLSKPKNTQEGEASSDELIVYRQRIERDLVEKVNATLLPLLGDGKFRTGVSVECDFTSGEQSEETYDPEKSVMTNSTKTEETSTNAGQTAGVPGTGSNLPRAQGRSASGGTSMSRRSETIAYQTSRTVKRMRVPQGSLRRISAAVLLDQGVRWEGQGSNLRRVLVPPTPESVRAIREVVAAAIGFTPNRGDQLVIESLPFESTLQEAPPPTATQKPAEQKPTNPFSLEALDARRLGAIGAIAVVAIAAYIFLRKRKKKSAVNAPDMKRAIGKGHERGAIEGDAREELSANAAKLLETVPEIGPPATARIDTIVQSLKETIAEDPALAASVLRTWLDDKRS